MLTKSSALYSASEFNDSNQWHFLIELNWIGKGCYIKLNYTLELYFTQKGEFLVYTAQGRKQSSVSIQYNAVGMRYILPTLLN